MSPLQHLPRPQQLPEGRPQVSSHHELNPSLSEPQPSLAQAPDAVDPFVAPSPGVACLLKMFACNPGSTSLACRLKQLGPAMEAVFAPVPEALAAEARLLADVPLGALPSGVSKPCTAFAASQVRVTSLTAASALPG